MRFLALPFAIAALIAPQSVFALDPGKAPPITLGTGSTGDVSGMSAAPSAVAGINTLSRSLFDSLRGTTFFVRPFLTDLTCASDQTANINAAALIAPAGAELVLPPGCVSVAGTTTITGRRIRGTGRGDGFGTELRNTASTGPALKLMGAGARVSDMRITCTADRATSTAVAIQMSDGIENPRGQQVDNIRIQDCNDQIDIQSGEFWSLTHFDMYRAKRYGLRIRNGFHPDSGDGSVVGGAIYTDTIAGGDAGIRLESGGGLKVASTKILQFNRGVDLAMADGAGTSDIFLDDTVSIENQYETGVWIGAAGPNKTGGIGSIKVNAQIAGMPTGVSINPGSSNISLTPILTNSTYGIDIKGGNNIAVGEGSVLTAMSTSGVVVRDPATNVSVGRFNCTLCAVNVQDLRTLDAGLVNRFDVRPIRALAYNANPSNFFQVGMPQFRGSRISVQVEGTLNGVGAVNNFLDVLAYNNGTTVPAPATISNVQGGQAPVDVIFNTTAAPGSIIIGVRVNSAYSTSTLTGSITIRVDGKTSQYQVLQ